MYFDPISTWLVSLIADGIVVAGNKGKCFSVTEYEQKRINEANASLNANIRRIKDKYGLVLAEAAYKHRFDCRGLPERYAAGADDCYYLYA